MATQADRIRRFVIENLDSLATQRDGRLCIRAGDVARGIGMSNRLPNVCSVLGGRKFREEAGLRLVDRTGPLQSTTTEFVYEPVSDLELPPVTPKTPAPALPPRPPASSREAGPSSEHTGSHQADAIRRFVIDNLDSLATRQLRIRAGDVARGIGMSNRLPNVCSVLGGRKLQEEAGLRLVDRTGPLQSTTTEFVYEPVAGEDLPPVAPKTPAPSPPPRPPPPSRGDGPSSEHAGSHQADAIRRFVIENLDSLATRRDGRLCIRAGDVARGLGLSNRLPNICSVLGGREFREEAGLRLVDRTGPVQSTTTEFMYEPVAGEDLPPVAPKTPAPSRGDGPSSEHAGSHQADAIRRFVIENLDSLATRRDGRLCIRAGDVARGLGLSNRLPNICSVLGGREFREEAGLRLVDRTGPVQSTTTEFVYEPVAGADSTPLAPKTPAPALPPQPATPSGRAASSSAHSESHGTVLCLVSCVSRKRQSPSPAKALYLSDWFIKARQVVKMEGWRWFILSAKYGLVDPDRPIEPYEKTLNNMSNAERRSWASDVWKALEPDLDGVRTVVFLAGQKYREDLEWRLRGRGIEVRVPMERLRIGEQLAWLNHWLTRSAPYGAEELDTRPRGGGVEVQAQPEAPRMGERQA